VAAAEAQARDDSAAPVAYAFDPASPALEDCSNWRGG
jgi:hypothetical protein